MILIAWPPSIGSVIGLPALHTRLVRFEALVNEKHASDRTVLVNVLHHTVDACRVVGGVALCTHAVSSFSVVLACCPRFAVVDALRRTFGSWFGACAICILRGCTVMSTRGHLVRITHRLVTVVTSVDDAACSVV